MTQKPVLLQDHEADTFEAIFARCVAAILASMGINITSEALKYIVMLAKRRMRHLFQTLHRITESQRRSNPSVSDVAIWLQETNVYLSDLQKGRALQSKYIDDLNKLRLDPEPEPLTDDEKTFFTPQSVAIKKVVPSRNWMNTWLPGWLPQLPPDHTFMATRDTVKRVTDPRELREMVVEEGRLAERALQNFVGVYSEEGDELKTYEDLEESSEIDRIDVEHALSENTVTIQDGTRLMEVDGGENNVQIQTKLPRQEEAEPEEHRPLPVIKIKASSLKLSVKGSNQFSSDKLTESDWDPFNIYTMKQHSLDIYEHLKKRALPATHYTTQSIQVSKENDTFDEVYQKALSSINVSAKKEPEFQTINWHHDWYER